MKKSFVRGVMFLGLFLLVLFLEPVVNLFSLFTIDDSKEVQVKVLESENKRLRQELEDIKEIYDINYGNERIIYGKVITRDIYSFYDELIINLGSDDGVKEGSAVVSSKGLLGIISKVFDDCSYVTLISNKKLNISVRVNDSYGNLNDFTISNMSNHSEIAVGDLVYTSGLTDVYEGVYIGEVIEVNMDNLEVEKILKIKSDVNYQQINYIGVIQ